MNENLKCTTIYAYIEVDGLGNHILSVYLLLRFRWKLITCNPETLHGVILSYHRYRQPQYVVINGGEYTNRVDILLRNQESKCFLIKHNFCHM